MICTTVATHSATADTSLNQLPQLDVAQLSLRIDLNVTVNQGQIPAIGEYNRMDHSSYAEWCLNSIQVLERAIEKAQRALANDSMTTTARRHQAIQEYYNGLYEVATAEAEDLQITKLLAILYLNMYRSMYNSETQPGLESLIQFFDAAAKRLVTEARSFDLRHYAPFYYSRWYNRFGVGLAMPTTSIRAYEAEYARFILGQIDFMNSFFLALRGRTNVIPLLGAKTYFEVAKLVSNFILIQMDGNPYANVIACDLVRLEDVVDDIDQALDSGDTSSSTLTLIQQSLQDVAESLSSCNLYNQ
ncbi:MAG: hypothetical protein CL677_03050 [Bdellovibrionaceae bacterium]|nr:hypothetical protein [Pseudobdellovibrionaceae bacterium]|tara:strand:+ start:102484 stop:103389 length:906 start_codon:yes stop_codon:yes gene_type:complete